MSYVPSKTPPPAARRQTGVDRDEEKRHALIAKQDAMLPKGGPDPKFTLPAIEKTKLSNGLNVWLVKQNELPIVSMNLVLNAGGTLENSDKAGVTQMTASMLTQGTKSRSALDIANSTQSIGASGQRRSFVGFERCSDADADSTSIRHSTSSRMWS